MTTRHVKVETDLRRQLLELEESRDQARNDANKAKENLAALDKIIKDEIACTEEDVLLEEGGEEGEENEQIMHVQSPNTAAYREKQRDFLESAPLPCLLSRKVCSRRPTRVYTMVSSLAPFSLSIVY